MTWTDTVVRVLEEAVSAAEAAHAAQVAQAAKARKSVKPPVPHVEEPATPAEIHMVSEVGEVRISSPTPRESVNTTTRVARFWSGSMTAAERSLYLRISSPRSRNRGQGREPQSKVLDALAERVRRFWFGVKA
jgi:hypothetical protein